MDKYNKSVQHNWFHHATWGSPKRKNEGIGDVIWHSLTEDGRVEIVDIRFGNTIYRNVSVDRLKPIDEASHSHPRSGKELDDKKKKRNKMTKEIAEQKLNLFLEKNVPTKFTLLTPQVIKKWVSIEETNFYNIYKKP